MVFKFNPVTRKLDITSVVLVPPGTVASISGDTGGAISPAGGNIAIQGNQPSHEGGLSFNGAGAGQIYGVILVDGQTTRIDGNGNLQASIAYIDLNAGGFATSNIGYYCNNTDPLTPFNIQLQPALDGDLINFIVTGTYNITITTYTGQYIRIGNIISSLGPSGIATSTLQGNVLNLRYQQSTSTWWATSVIGTWNLT
jgi:hypothetical protein